MERVILHVDANSYYAAIECLYNPAIRDLPVAVCGDPEARHGIVLTKNQVAKRFGIQTGEAIFQARQKCPGLVIVKPDYDLYLRFTRDMRKIFSEYSPLVEPYGLDEAWLDVTNPRLTMMDGERIANEIRDRIRKELGITVSVGVSFNKVFAKLGSDMRKPDATTVISTDDFREKVWPLPASDLLFIGRKRGAELLKCNIRTIGDLARTEDDLLKYKMGKVGLMLKAYALGWDSSPVCPDGLDVPLKSIGNSTTAPHDVETLDDAKCIFYLLAENIGTRLRSHGFRSNCVSISVRTPELVSFSCQRTLHRSTNLTGEVAKAALELFSERYAHNMPYRSVGIHCQSLVPESVPEQIDLWGDHAQRDKMLRLDQTIDTLQGRFGRVIHRGIVHSDRQYSQVQPEGHIRPAAAFFGGQ